MDGIMRLLNPGTIALIGASEKEGAPGATILKNLLLSQKRKIFPVNPNRKTVLGLPCYASIAEVPERVDLAVVATPAVTVPQLVEECGKAGVDGMIIISSGFREVGEEGKKIRRTDNRRSGRRYGMQNPGPELPGLRPAAMRPGRHPSWSSAPERGNIALISQECVPSEQRSLDWAIDAHIGFSYLYLPGLHPRCGLRGPDRFSWK